MQGGKNKNQLIERVLEVKHAQKLLAQTTNEQRCLVLRSIAERLLEKKESLFEANKLDLEAAEAQALALPLRKRLFFSDEKLKDVCNGMLQIADLADPIHAVLEARELDEGLILERVSAPIGVIGMIFESRPDALVQIASLCLKSGNAVILKGGREALHTNKALTAIFSEVSESMGLAGAGSNWIHLVESREDVQTMLELDNAIDLLIPRGSNRFVRYIMDNTKIPVLGHADGICAAYIAEDADIDLAVRIVKDAKCQYPAACNAIETLLINADIAEAFLPELYREFTASGVEIRGCNATQEIISCTAAVAEDFDTEFLDLIIAVKIVASIEEAIEHIHMHGSGHTDAIITTSSEKAEYFLQAVDSADVFWNCSTRFADGFRYGLGAEVGISTQKIHARGPVGLQGLTTSKWKLRGNGHIVADYTGPKAKNFTHKDL